MHKIIKISPQEAKNKRAYSNNPLAYHNKNRYMRKFDFLLLPSPVEYYKQEFLFIKIKLGWVQVHCCFHDDSTPSLRINLVEGHFICFGCGTKGHNIIVFHMKRYGLSLSDALNHFGVGSHG